MADERLPAVLRPVVPPSVGLPVGQRPALPVLEARALPVVRPVPRTLTPFTRPPLPVRLPPAGRGLAPLPARPLPRPRPQQTPPTRPTRTVAPVGTRPRPHVIVPQRAPERSMAPQVERPGFAIRPPVPAGAYAHIVVNCPCCGRLSPLGSFDGAPYDAQIWQQTVGGPVQPGRLRVSPSGRVTDHRFNSRGSIDKAPYWDAALAHALEEQLADIADEVGRLAREGNLATPGQQE